MTNVQASTSTLLLLTRHSSNSRLLGWDRGTARLVVVGSVSVVTLQCLILIRLGSHSHTYCFLRVRRPWRTPFHQRLRLGSTAVGVGRNLQTRTVKTAVALLCHWLHSISIKLSLVLHNLDQVTWPQARHAIHRTRQKLFTLVTLHVAYTVQYSGSGYRTDVRCRTHSKLSGWTLKNSCLMPFPFVLGLAATTGY